VENTTTVRKQDRLIITNSNNEPKSEPKKQSKLKEKQSKMNQNEEKQNE